MKKKLKILVATLAAAVAAIFISGCNMSCGLGNYTFNYVHILKNDLCFEITKWYENSTGIEVSTPYGSMFFSEGTYILLEGPDGYCPICRLLEEE